MNDFLLQLLVCPKCKNKLELIPEIHNNTRYKEGVLKCNVCKTSYIIFNFIPRFVPKDGYAKTFSFEWKIHAKTQLDSKQSKESERTFIEKTSFTAKEVKGKLVLDAGVGMGRFADVVSNWGGTVIGIDLSYSVDVAFKNLCDRENVHLIQADIFSLPFKEEIFDLIYSIGVLHHTPDCKSAFMKLIPLLKKCGKIAIWVYDSYNRVFVNSTDILRKLTTRMPAKVLYTFCFILSFTLYYFYQFGDKFFKPIKSLWFFFPVAMHKNWRWRVLDTFDWYSPRYQSKHTYYEVVQWFKDAGLKNIEILEHPVSVVGTKE